MIFSDMMDLCLEKAANIIYNSKTPSRDKYLAFRFIKDSSELSSSMFINKLMKSKLFKNLGKIAVYNTDQRDPFMKGMFKSVEKNGWEYRYFFYRLMIKAIKRWNSRFGKSRNGKSTPFHQFYQDMVKKGVRFGDIRQKSDDRLAFFGKMNP